MLTDQFCDSGAKTRDSSEHSRYCGSQCWTTFLLCVDVYRSHSGKCYIFLPVIPKSKRFGSLGIK